MRNLLFQVEQQQPVVDQPVTSTTSVQSATATGQESPEKQRKKHKVCVVLILKQYCTRICEDTHIHTHTHTTLG